MVITALNVAAAAVFGFAMYRARKIVKMLDKIKNPQEPVA
jgi:uncharacterized membrane protein